MSHQDYKNWAEKKGDVFKLEISVTMNLEDPIPSGPDQVVSTVNKVIMMDEGTTDFSIRCDTKTFRVHKSFLCNRSANLKYDIFLIVLQIKIRIVNISTL